MSDFKGKKVLVFGLGLNQGGVGSALFFAKHKAEVRVTDLKTEKDLKPSIDQLKDYPDIEYSLGGHKNEDIEWADIIIKNPGVKPHNPYLELGKKLGKRIEQDMGIFLEFVKPSQIVGVTGTKGKSTTASLIYEMLNKTQPKTRRFNSVNPRGWIASNIGNIILTGNIGKSVLDDIDNVKKDTLVILELSSFQLETFDQKKVSPKWAVITNIYPDHLNYYSSMNEYIAAKKIIGLYQTPNDFLFINKDDSTINNPEFLNGLKGKIYFYYSNDLPEDFKPYLQGQHNLSNMAAALAVGKTFGIDEISILKVLKNFKGVPFRMELVKIWNGVRIINDTTATGPDAAIQSIKTFPNSILICGGMNKGMDYKEFAKTVDKYVRKVFFLEGDSTEEIKNELSAISHQSSEKIMGVYNTFEELLKDVKKIIKPGDIILFSPAATSFNLFQNEFDRGRKFNEAVKKVFRILN